MNVATDLTIVFKSIFNSIKDCIVAFTVLTSCVVELGCSPYLNWNEEVNLIDGRVVIVQQKRRMEGHIPREEWLTISLPELDRESIIWHENLVPIVVNVYKNKLYVVGDPPTNREMRLYNVNIHQYVGFVWNGEKFERISFQDIPKEIYSVNMLLEFVPPRGTTLLTLTEKNSTELNGRVELRYRRQIAPQ